MFTISITIDDVIDAVSNYLIPFSNGVEIIRAQTNRVPAPVGEFITLNEIGQYEIETPEIINDPDSGIMTIINLTKIVIQIDFYGNNGGDYARAFLSAFRSTYGYDNFPDGIKPLYCDDIQQMGFILDNRQYNHRWTIRCYLAYNPIMTLPQQYADDFELNLFVNVDTEIQ
jgi:hypothetical protein